jgi:cytochrome c553
VLAGVSSASTDAGPPANGRLKYHMRRSLNDVQTIERLLVAGKLEEARTLAFMLTRHPPGLPQTAESRDVVLAAGALVNATTIEQAIYTEVRVASACARCHARVQKLPVFRMPSQAPPDRPQLVAQMARHQWAVDRLWEGLVGASHQHWQAGLYVIATSQFPGTEKPEHATRLQLLARAALEDRASTLDTRASRYGDLLVTCAGCHARRARALQSQQP